VPPMRTVLDHRERANELPTRVTEDAPLDAPFVWTTELIWGTLNVKALATQAEWPAVETPTALASAIPQDTRPTTELSESHLLVVAAVPPMRLREVWSFLPRLEPMTVTEMAPVAAELLGRTLLAATWKVMTLDSEQGPAWCAEIATASLEPTCCPTRSFTEDSDCQTLTSAPVPPTRVIMVLWAMPESTPTTVTDMAPVAGVLVRTTELGQAWS